METKLFDNWSYTGHFVAGLVFGLWMVLFVIGLIYYGWIMRAPRNVHRFARITECAWWRKAIDRPTVQRLARDGLNGKPAGQHYILENFAVPVELLLVDTEEERKRLLSITAVGNESLTDLSYAVTGLVERNLLAVEIHACVDTYLATTAHVEVKENSNET